MPELPVHKPLEVVKLEVVKPTSRPDVIRTMGRVINWAVAVPIMAILVALIFVAICNQGSRDFDDTRWW